MTSTNVNIVYLANLNLLVSQSLPHPPTQILLSTSLQIISYIFQGFFSSQFSLPDRFGQDEKQHELSLDSKPSLLDKICLHSSIF